MQMNVILLVILWILGTLAFCAIAIVVAKKYGVEYLIGLFAASIVMVAALGSKIVQFGMFSVSASTIIFSITFFFTDAISEFWGKKYTKKAVWAGFLANLLFLFSVYIAVHWPGASFWTGQEAFVQTLGGTWRIALGSTVAYVIAQNHDVWAYHFWKDKFNDKHLWLRNNFSTGVSQIIDTIIFTTIAFYGLFPIGQLMLGLIVMKFIIAALDTPFLYLVRWYFRRDNSFKHRVMKEERKAKLGV